jgi:hypothetical protein
MLLKSKFIRIVFALCLVFSLAALVVADTIRLKDGSIIKGKIVNFTGGQFTVVFGDGARQRKMNFYADEIESIEFDATSMPVSVVKTTTQLPVKSNPQTNNNPVTNSPKTETNNSVIIPATTNTSSNTTNNPTYTNQIPITAKPVQLSVKVLADNTANGWTNTGWVVKKGQKIKISGKGSVSLGNGNYSTPNGLSSIADKEKLMQDKPTGALIAVIGDDNNAFIFIGETTEFVAARDGSLFLGINEANLDDNSGAFEVSIEITPN